MSFSGQPEGDQRVTSQIEEAVIRRYIFAEFGFPNCDELVKRRGLSLRGGIHHRYDQWREEFGEGDFSGGSPWQTVDRYYKRWHEVPWNSGANTLSQCNGIVTVLGVDY